MSELKQLLAGFDQCKPVSVARICACCRQRKPASEFRPNPNLECGLHTYCRECCAAKQRAWRAKNPERVAAYNAARLGTVRSPV